jgi:hypothetical protein
MKTRIAYYLAAYGLAILFISTDLNPLLLIEKYRTLIQSINPHVHFMSFFLALSALAISHSLLGESGPQAPN